VSDLTAIRYEVMTLLELGRVQDKSTSSPFAVAVRLVGELGVFTGVPVTDEDGDPLSHAFLAKTRT
jgi:hypothetical protein